MAAGSALLLAGVARGAHWLIERPLMDPAVLAGSALLLVVAAGAVYLNPAAVASKKHPTGRSTAMFWLIVVGGGIAAVAVPHLPAENLIFLQRGDAGYLAAVFSLAGVLLWVAALATALSVVLRRASSTAAADAQGAPTDAGT